MKLYRKPIEVVVWDATLRHTLHRLDALHHEIDPFIMMNPVIEESLEPTQDLTLSIMRTVSNEADVFACRRPPPRMRKV